MWCDGVSPRQEFPWLFVNLIGGQDELVFDGNSFVMDALGEVTMRAPAFTEGLYAVDLEVAPTAAIRRAGRSSRLFKAKMKASMALWYKARAIT